MSSFSRDKKPTYTDINSRPIKIKDFEFQWAFKEVK